MSYPNPAGVFAIILCLGVFGCGGSLEAPADPLKGEEAVRTAFGSWKRGAVPATLQSQRPPIYLNEPEWIAGNRLLDFEIVEPLEPYGRQLRCAVKIAVQNAKTGAKMQRRIGYQVETNPAFVIVREGL